jgi:hypothetical protein
MTCVSMGGILLNVMEGLDEGTKEGNDELKRQGAGRIELVGIERDISTSCLNLTPGNAGSLRLARCFRIGSKLHKRNLHF